MANLGTSSGRFLVEMDGVSAMRASEVSGVGVKHTPYKIAVGDQANPILGRSNYEPSEVTLKHAHALNSTGDEIFDWFIAFINGDTVEKRNFRLIQLGENGFETIKVYNLSECVPTEFTHESNKGDSNDAAYFTLKLQPSDIS